MSRIILAALVCACALAPAATAAPAKKPKPQPDYSAQLQKAVTVQGMLRHERALANIAERNGGTRASGTAGFNKSRDYVVGQLQDAGYDVTVQPFDFPYFEESSALHAGAPTAGPTPQGPGNDFNIMQYSGSGDVTAPLVAGRPHAPARRRAQLDLRLRGRRLRRLPGRRRRAGPARHVRVRRQGRQRGRRRRLGGRSSSTRARRGRTDSQGGTLGGAKDVPVLFTSFAVGNDLADQAAAGTTVHVVTTTVNETRETYNVLADTKKGDPARTIVVGSHLDSRHRGPGHQRRRLRLRPGPGDRRCQLPKVLKKPKNKIRFAFWGAEESGLLGSTHYVEGLTQDQKDDIMANLNFDMVASPNYARLIYDGDGSDNPDTGPGPVGSDVIEQLLSSLLGPEGPRARVDRVRRPLGLRPVHRRGHPGRRHVLRRRGDRRPPSRPQRYGGTAGAPFDACYHQACDNLQNLNLQAFDEFSDNAANAVVTLAQRPADLTDNTAARRR